MKNSILLFFVWLLFAGKIHGQAVGIGTATPNSSAQLDITSTSKGILVPRVSLSSLADAATILNPATSLLVYNTNAGLAGGVGYYYNSGTPAAPAWVKILTSTTAGWSLTGNAGTDPAINFIGTTDASKPLKFRVSNVPSGSIDHLTRSTFFGAEAGQNHPFVGNVSSTGVGYQVMSVNAGFSNAAVGALSMANNGQGGSRNSALGYESLYSNVDGQRNVAIGHTALRANTGGDENVAVGDSALASNTLGNNNIAIGANALKRNLTSGGNVAVGYYALENTTNNSNVAVGHYSMRANTTGGANTAVGWASLNSNLNGDRNVAIGHYAMEDNLSGIYNAALGYGCLRENTSGEHNTGLGYIALNGNHAGDFNTAVGSFALAGNDGGNNTVVGYDALGNANNTSNNIAIGKSALNRMTYTNDGSLWSGDNIAIGVEALFSTNPSGSSNLIPTNGVSNIGVGNYALRANTTGESNVAVGHQSLYNNTTGFWNDAIGQQSLYFNTIGNYNVALGQTSLRNNIDGTSNVAVGTVALYNNTSGNNNTAVGYAALNANTSGINNTAVGSGAGSFNNANTYCTFLGYEADQDAGTNYSSSMALGYNSTITASSQVRIGSTTTASIGGYQPWSNLSDGRFKKNISEQVKGLDFIMALRPVTYNIDVNKLAGYLKEDVYKDKTGNILAKPVNARLKEERNEESLVLHTGFVAQEVEAAAKKLNYDFSGIDKPKNATDLYALRYSEFVVPLVKGMQEQQQEITALKEKIQKLEELLKIVLADKK